jgi:ABC-type nickel/cobalt efflux system permease component RcnA
MPQMSRKLSVNVDAVALVLAVSLGLGIVLIMTAVLIQVIDHEPVQTLGENTTQVLTAIIGGLIGVLGGYVGARVQQHKDSSSNDDPDEPRETGHNHLGH